MRVQVRLKTAESQNQELQASVARLEKERVVLEAQIATLSQFVGSRWTGIEGGSSGGNSDGHDDVLHLQEQIQVLLAAELQMLRTAKIRGPGRRG